MIDPKDVINMDVKPAPGIPTVSEALSKIQEHLAECSTLAASVGLPDLSMSFKEMNVALIYLLNDCPEFRELVGLGSDPEKCH